MQSGNFLIISDLQIPFEAHHALDFCKYLKKWANVPDENILNVGDEVDNLNGGMYPKDPDGHHTPNSEIKEAKEKIKQWVAAFPYMRIAISNHGLRWIKKSSMAEIPSQMMRAYQDVLQMPDTWQWSDSWLIETKHRFRITHGMSFGGKTPYRQAAEMSAISVAFGHLHSSAGICRVKTEDKDIWSMNTGCLIDTVSYAFKYNKNDKFKPTLGAGVIVNDGSTPIWVPYN